MASMASTQQRMRELEASFTHDICRNNEKQEQKFGEELKRLEKNTEGLTKNHANNAGLEERMRELEIGDGAQKASTGQSPQSSAGDHQSAWQPRHVILGGWVASKPSRQSKRRLENGWLDSRHHCVTRDCVYERIFH